MRTIWKFPLEANHTQQLLMPANAKILTVQSQFNEPMMWAIVDPEAEKEPRKFALYATGSGRLPDNFETDHTYINTFQADGGNYVFHLFECKN